MGMRALTALRRTRETPERRDLCRTYVSGRISVESGREEEEEVGEMEMVEEEEDADDIFGPASSVRNVIPSAVYNVAVGSV